MADSRETNLWGQVREHLGLLASASLVVVVAVRIASVSEWNPQTASALLQYGGAGNVLLGATLQAIPTLIAYVIALGIAWLIWACGVERRWPSVREGLWALTAVLVLVVVANLYTLGVSLVLWLAATGLGVSDRKRDRNLAERENRRIAYSLVGGLLALSYFWGSNPWLAVEHVVTADGEFSGFIVGTTGDETVVLKRDPREVVFLDPGELKSHRLCEGGGIGALTLPQALGGRTPNYPDCP